jgi:hypothetical protein
LVSLLRLVEPLPPFQPISLKVGGVPQNETTLVSWLSHVAHLMELETHLVLANRLGFLVQNDLMRLSTDIESVGKMLNALITSLRNRDG